MAEIRNYTMNFSSGRPTGLTCSRKLAFTEIHGLWYVVTAVFADGVVC